ncbi:tRNA (uridine(34)/cytosine(34)/5-carboxymethylaminomethyluridine(34)-2'-O)-methyltransferase TrmL [Fictibacillus phosphorivorans]|uniref:tRNA (uridine(34)/cytosine(34)/5- carboxymethylaminomethyluridine(34)-2'-O)- methyltransferase TrmL n=1 Tax=Fictibacillus phosphorivorans TaxID=1221500 RepID=UPI00203D488A|nr:tRNA (uridine(34)/cytosine(34)/5-carboxymethylaminomethyluridine(34)-2'-O)-methyltransferase TrmL [Fictibacillus phosphorivorans]MCM3717585.1 tRNA (uridine(34)/cytosine(34)/5-carboxymethylaminomethyluridine(34)-2'-O)-methyltransferase TrmL [Fictibacillus phosphorivorans]MCM3775280.1 tRNA (uridine(34)/cytosine(34)/5-carboxymethylaminomethyluridine(34)-2'-O)-methyltransferase TrmL [Fictibacillus phosphorivorans]
MAIHVVLFEPLIPANTGNIARTCAGTSTHLHLIHPLGFSLEDKYLKRAGLDYWEHVKIHHHDSLDAFYKEYSDGEFYYITKFGEQTYSDFDYSDAEKDVFFVFGKETKGLPREVIDANMDRCLRIPMNEHIRSLNLSNTAAILIYEALRQQDFRDLK